MSIIDVTNPGLVNAGDEGFGLGVSEEVTPGSAVADQAFDGLPENVDAGSEGFGGVPKDVTPGAAVADQAFDGLPENVDAGSEGVGTGASVDVTIGTEIADQVFGNGITKNVFV